VSWHVYPVKDTIEHATSGGDCICGPDLEATDNGNLWTHHSLDGREQHEPKEA
jgi:hypothetical protein